MNDWIANIFENPDLLRMGHGQRREDNNLGLGWLYYALARSIRPATAVVIGSFRGFVPLVLGKALSENCEPGKVLFIDPSYVDDFWRDPQKVEEYFRSSGVPNVHHYLMTTQQFVSTESYRSLRKVGIVFVDGYHSEEQVRFDFEAFSRLLSTDGVILFHDSLRVRTTTIYGPERAYEHRVKCWIDKLKQDENLQVFDLPLFEGVTLVRKSS